MRWGFLLVTFSNWSYLFCLFSNCPFMATLSYVEILMRLHAQLLRWTCQDIHFRKIGKFLECLEFVKNLSHCRTIKWEWYSPCCLKWSYDPEWTGKLLLLFIADVLPLFQLCKYIPEFRPGNFECVWSAARLIRIEIIGVYLVFPHTPYPFYPSFLLNNDSMSCWRTSELLCMRRFLLSWYVLYDPALHGDTNWWNYLLLLAPQPTGIAAQLVTWTLIPAHNCPSFLSFFVWPTDTLLISVRHTDGKEWAFPASATHLPGWQLTDMLLSGALLNCCSNRLSHLPDGLKKTW